MATTTQETGRHIALVDIRVPDNVRDLDPEHVKALAGSIGLQGMLVPVVVRNDGDGFELVAGFHRVAAARSLGLTAVPGVIRDAQTEDADRAVENITSCRRRHDVIYADAVVMPTLLSSSSQSRRTGCEQVFMIAGGRPSLLSGPSRGGEELGCGIGGRLLV